MNLFQNVTTPLSYNHEFIPKRYDSIVSAYLFITRNANEYVTFHLLWLYNASGTTNDIATISSYSNLVFTMYKLCVEDLKERVH